MMSENINNYRTRLIIAYLKELTILKQKIDFYNSIFCKSENVEKINCRNDLKFMQLIQSSLNDSVIAGVARLFLDDKFQHKNKKKGQERLCLDYFIDEYKGKEYEKALVKIKDFVNKYKVKSYRNNYLSHSDLDVKMGFQKYPHGMDENSLNCLLEITINLFINLLEEESGNIPSWLSLGFTFEEFPKQFLDKLNL